MSARTCTSWPRRHDALLVELCIAGQRAKAIAATLGYQRTTTKVITKAMASRMMTRVTA